jgi:hypothetical protein
LAEVGAAADDVLCLATPEPFWAVGAWFADFSQTTDEDVIAILGRYWAQDGQEPEAGRLETRAPGAPEHLSVAGIEQRSRHE